MKDDVSQPTNDNASRVFKIFLFGGFCISAVTVTLYWAGHVLWTDFLHSNPDRTHREAWSELLGAPFIGVVVVLINLSFALFTGAIAAALGCKFLHRMPFWYLLIMFPICLMASYQQELYMNSTWGDEVDWKYYIEWISPHILAYLLGCWWLSRRAMCSMA